MESGTIHGQQPELREMRVLIAAVFCCLEFLVQLTEIKRHSDCQKEKTPHNKASNQTTVS